MFAGPLLKADCRRCRRLTDPVTRAMQQRELGCHEDAPAPVWRANCPCGGDRKCDQCQGTGLRRYYRCPGSMLAGRPDVANAATAWIQYDARNVLPTDGAWLDQAASFTEAVSALDRERGYWDDRKDEERERKARQAQGS